MAAYGYPYCLNGSHDHSPASITIGKQAEKLIDAGEFDFVGTDCHRIEQLMLLEDNLRNPYIHKIGNYLVKNLVI